MSVSLPPSMSIDPSPASPPPAHLLGEESRTLAVKLRLSEIELRERLIEHLREVDRLKQWKGAGYSSLREFCEDELSLSPAEVREILVEMNLILPSDRLVSGDRDVQVRIEALRRWRLQRSKLLGWAAYRVISNRTLLRLAQLAPKNEAELMATPGIGPKKSADFGHEILSVVADPNASADLFQPNGELHSRERLQTT